MNEATKREIGEKLMNRVEGIFPIDKEINYKVDFKTENLMCRVRWKLSNYDCSIIIIIPENALKKYLIDEEKSLEIFYQYINDKYKEFNHNHDDEWWVNFDM